MMASITWSLDVNSAISYVGILVALLAAWFDLRYRVKAVEMGVERHQQWIETHEVFVKETMAIFQQMQTTLALNAEELRLSREHRERIEREWERERGR